MRSFSLGYLAGAGPLLFLTVALSLALSGCATTAQAPPEPVIRTVEVRVPVPVPCPAATRLGPPPAYPDTDEAIGAATGLRRKVQLLLAGRELRMARSEATEAALRACEGAAATPLQSR